MKDIFQIKLSARELFVVSALLGYESVFGIEDDAFLLSGVEMKTQIRQTVQQLERKKLIRYDLDGTLYIKPEFKKTIDCICCADTVGCFSSNLGTGKKVAVYVMEKNSDTVTVENTGNGKYKLYLDSHVPAHRIFSKELLTPQNREINEMMLLEEVQYAQAQIEAFNSEEAKECIGKHTHDKNAVEMIARILGKKCGYMSFQIHQRSKQLYKAVCDGLFVCDGDCTVSVSIDSNDVVRFKSIPPYSVLKCMNNYLSFCDEEGMQ